jgi:hypothetical protein
MGSPVNAETGAYLLIIVIPLTVVWVIALVDIVRQEHMSTRAKWTWAILCSVIWPVLIVYLLTRPVQGRFERSESRDYPHARLVDAVLAHEDGRIGDDQFDGLVRELRA